MDPSSDRPRNIWLTRSGVTTATSHLLTSAGVLSVVVTAERRYGPCRLSVNNKGVSPGENDNNSASSVGTSSSIVTIVTKHTVLYIHTGTTQPRCRCIWSTLTPLLWHQPPCCTTIQTFYGRQPSFSGCRHQDLERTAGQSTVSSP